MHGADQHLHLVALEQAVDVLWRLRGIRLIVQAHQRHIASTELIAVFLEVEFEGCGYVLAKRSERAGER
jgi:hypothetical protein